MATASSVRSPTSRTTRPHTTRSCAAMCARGSSVTARYAPFHDNMRSLDTPWLHAPTRQVLLSLPRSLPLFSTPFILWLLLLD
jgi:hypothetical protein